MSTRSTCRGAAAVVLGALAFAVPPGVALADGERVLEPAPAPRTAVGAASDDARTFAFWPQAQVGDEQTVRLSDERRRTYNAHIRRGAIVRRAPSTRGRRVGRLKPFTYYGLRDLVVVLETHQTERRMWARVRYSGLGRRIGWVPAAALARPRLVRTRLVIDRGRTRVRLFRSGRLVFGTRAGIGARSSPTPGGRFFIRERLRPRRADTIYGPLAFGLSTYSRYRTDWPGGGQVGLHGTNQPGLIPGRISNGCIRVRNAEILRLGRMMPVGTPVLIR